MEREEVVNDLRELADYYLALAQGEDYEADTSPEDCSYWAQTVSQAAELIESTYKDIDAKV